MEEGYWNTNTEIQAADVFVGNATFDILLQDDILICDTGASTHSLKSKYGSVNERSSDSSSLGYAGKATKATSMIDVPGQFVEWDGTLVMKETLGDCNYNQEYNFNLCSLTRLLGNGWSIDKGDAMGYYCQDRGWGKN